jgi:hypothetical protein
MTLDEADSIVATQAHPAIDSRRDNIEDQE